MPGILFVLCCSLFVGHQFLQKVAGRHIPLLDNYLDPLLLMPVLLHLVTWERRVLYKDKSYKLPLTHIVAYLVSVSFIAEVVFPIFHRSHIADPLDLGFYILGASCYLWAGGSAKDFKRKI